MADRSGSGFLCHRREAHRVVNTAEACQRVCFFHRFRPVSVPPAHAVPAAAPGSAESLNARRIAAPYGRGAGVGRGRGVGLVLQLGVAVGVAVGVGLGGTVAVGVAVAVAVGVAVGVGVGLAAALQKISIELSGVMPSLA